MIDIGPNFKQCHLHPLHDLKVNATVLEVLCKVLRWSLKDLFFPKPYDVLGSPKL